MIIIISCYRQLRRARQNPDQTDRSQRYGYVYDALGRRIEKHQLDNTGKPCNRTRFLWDGLRMIQETGTNQHRSLYIYTDQSSYEPLARIDKRGNDPEKVMYFHTDLNGCPEELTDENGEILWECSFQLWGKRIHEIEHEPIEQNLRYQGQYLDRETGLHYNTFRYYDPDIGRFTQPDPIGLLGGFNLYQYAPNGLTWVDPTGLSKCGPNKSTKQGYHKETYDPKPVKPENAVYRWEEFLGAGPYSNKHPRTGLPDHDRIVSADGKRSIRYGNHEMNSKPTKHHYHDKT